MQMYLKLWTSTSHMNMNMNMQRNQTDVILRRMTFIYIDGQIESSVAYVFAKILACNLHQ